MKVVILAGGFGTRLSEESVLKPKPMLEIGDMPIIWHIMKIYSHYGFNEFIICAGYKQHYIKQWFSDYFFYTSDITFDYSEGNQTVTVHNKHTEPWKVTIVDTGLKTQTGGRLKRVRDYLGNDEFMLTYGDAVGDININSLLDYHYKHGCLGTITMYNFGQNKGVVESDTTGRITSFREKSELDGDMINIGFMVFKPEVLDYIEGDETTLEKGLLELLVKDEQLAGYCHKGYWQCMDTMREKKQIEKLWEENKAPWKIW